MIKFENGDVQLEGTGAQLCVELSIITKKVRESIAEIATEEIAEEKIGGGNSRL